MSKKAKVYKRKPTGAKKFVNKKTIRNSSKSGYDAIWQKYRFRFLHHNPKCYCCGERATIVDHIVAHKGNMELFKRLSNHMPLCKLDHDKITGLYDRNVIQDLSGKYIYINKRREETNTIVRIKVLPSYGDGKIK